MYQGILKEFNIAPQVRMSSDGSVDGPVSTPMHLASSSQCIYFDSSPTFLYGCREKVALVVPPAQTPGVVRAAGLV